MKKNQTDKKSAAAPEFFGLLKKIPKKRAAIFAVAAAVVIALNALLTGKFTLCGKSISAFTAAFIIIVCLIGYVIAPVFKNEKLRRCMKGIAAAALISFAAETFIFNFRSFCKDGREYRCDGTALSCSNPEAVNNTGDYLLISDATEIYVDVNDKNINAVRLEFAEEEHTRSSFNCYAAIKDGNFTREYIRIGEKEFSTSAKECRFTFNSYETLQSVLVGFNSLSAPMRVKGIYVATAVRFAFSELRFYAIFLLSALIAAIITLELYKVQYNRKNSTHRCIIMLLTVISTLSILFYKNPNMGAIEYKEDMNVSWYDPFVQMFDAVYEGHSYIDITPSESLLAMENPYDTSVRSAESVEVHWDRAFYKGKYYSYYGIAPVLTYYFPYYFMYGELPNTNNACVFFGALAVLFLIGTIMAFVRKFVGKPNFMLLLMSIPAAISASGIWFNTDFGDMYALPGITGTCFLMLCLWSGFEACIRIREKIQPVFFIVCGTAFSLCLASKPTRALSCLILAPIFLELLFRKDVSVKRKVISVASFMIPVIAGCGAVMAYNYARFESPFEFGAVYQLTVSNVTASGLSLVNLPNAIFQYFLQPIQMTGRFPFMNVGPVFMADHPAYVYCDSTIGALAIPWLLTGIIVFPFLLHSYKRKKFALDGIGAKKMLFALMLAMSVFIAWFNYSIAGVILSYICDILPVMSLLATFAIIDAQKKLSAYAVTADRSAVLFTAVGAVSFFLVSMLMFSFGGLALTENLPDLKISLEKLLCFWS